VAFDGPDGYVVALEQLAELVKPKRPLGTSAWAQRYRVLTAKNSAEPGRWRNERVPFVNAIHDALDPRHPADTVVVVGSSQVVKSEVGLNWIGRTIHQEPASFLALFPTDKVARKWVRTKLDGMIASTPELRKLVPLGRKANQGNTLSEKHYPGGVLYTGSANIPDDLASISVANVLFEEVDRMPIVLEDEGDPIELALRRMATFTRRKAYMNSTPTTAETSRIWPAWLSSTMDRYFVPCPFCNHMQFLRWAQMKWPHNAPHQAGYVCEECDQKMSEHHKTTMLAEGTWRATHPERETSTKGFHLNGMYTPIGLGDSWAKHALAWERAQGSVARIQVFFNTRLGEVHKGERVKVDWEVVKGRAEPYRLRTIPPGVFILTSGTDVQIDRLETQVLGFKRDERIAVIDYVVHRGDVTRPEVWAELDAYLAQPIINSFGIPMRLACSMVDSGYLPDTVLSFTRPRRGRGIFASRGSTNANKQAIGKPGYPDVKRMGKTDNRRFGAERYELGVSVLKHWVYEHLRSDGGTEELPVPITQRHIAFSDELPEVYFRQLTAETWDPKEGWIGDANYHSNEALDTFIMARAASMHHTVAVHRMREADYLRLEQLLQPAEGVPSKPAAQLGMAAIPRMGGFLPMPASTEPPELP
jgi:phage terminase large subunit GpA-like protein